MAEVMIGSKTLVFSPPVNAATRHWGVYSIPRMWRIPSGRLVVRFNGEQDCSDPDMMNMAPHLYFISDDNGETWHPDPHGESLYDKSVLQGITPPYLHLSDGKWIALRTLSDRKPIENVPCGKEFIFPNLGSYLKAYPQADIPEECKGIELLTYADANAQPEVSPVSLHFPEWEVLVESKAYEGGGYKDIPNYVKPVHWKNPYISALTELPDCSLGALVCGQHPDVYDRYCSAIYFVVSDDGGKTWHKRATAAAGMEDVPYGYGGDGHEVSLALTGDGILVCAMRMDVSVSPKIATPICDCYVTVSKDLGHTWCKPFPVADSSVTPQLITLDDEIVVLFYGRPGVHFKYSEDGGMTWSRAYSLIGKTLEEERLAGRSDFDSKYGDTVSYSNIFIERLSSDSVLVLYNDLKYDEGDGVPHKAAFVRKITLNKGTQE